LLAAFAEAWGTAYVIIIIIYIFSAHLKRPDQQALKLDNSHENSANKMFLKA